MKRLVRIEEGSVIAGVCTGLASYFDIDVAIVRIIALIMLFVGGGLLAYIIAWIAMPHADELS